MSYIADYRSEENKLNNGDKNCWEGYKLAFENAENILANISEDIETETTIGRMNKEIADGIIKEFKERKESDLIEFFAAIYESADYIEEE